MAPSALYRYFDGRDALLGRPDPLGAYESLADCRRGGGRRGPWRPGLRRRALSRRCSEALRLWALERPHEWGLVFGTPVPGYEAPFDTVVPYARVAAALVRPRRRGNGSRAAPSHCRLPLVSAELAAALAPVTEGSSPACRPSGRCWPSRPGRP